MRLLNIFFTHLKESRKMVLIDFSMLFSQSEFQVFEYILILFYQYFYIFQIFHFHFHRFKGQTSSKLQLCGRHCSS
jgi:hypothetical protein